LLRMDGHETREAFDGPEALRLTESFDPHLILLDIGMPTMDGYAVTRAIRSSVHPQQPVIVALTGYTDQPPRSAALKLGSTCISASLSPITGSSIIARCS
jgi:CheY-like chemotaxis protein